MSDIKIHKVNEATLYIKTDNPDISKELSNYFSVFADNYRFQPLYKQGKWDGKLRFFNYQNQLPIGLLDMLKKFCKEGGYSYEQNFVVEDIIDKQEVLRFIESLNLPDNMETRDYQLQAVYDILTYKHVSAESTTSSGKSMILYIIARWMMKQKKKVILIVPSVQLVEQMFGDFYDYGWTDLEEHCCRIYAGQKRMMEKPVTISTWQSLYKDKEPFAAYDCMMIDEGHLGAAKSLSEITKACINASYRISVSGTFPDERTASWFTIVGGTGSIRTFSTYSSLKEAGHIADFDIIPLVLSYPIEMREENYNLNGRKRTDDEEEEDDTEIGGFSEETEYINTKEIRHQFLAKLVQSLKGNTIVLFTKTDKHGKPLFETFKKMVKGKTIYYTDGSTPVAQREVIRREISKRDDIVWVASFGTASTGLNAPNLHNAVFAANYKSKVKVLQSLGRILRKHISKEKARLFDIIDDMTYINPAKKIRYINHSVRHYRQRKKLYEAQGFELNPIKYELKG